MGALPIDAYERTIRDIVRRAPVSVIVAETGSGKSTRVPLMLLREGFGRSGLIGVTQPRRVAAMSLAEWVAQQNGTPCGDVIGYQIGGERVDSRATQVKFMTEGVVLGQLHRDPRLRGYEVIVVDEAHERGVDQDLLIALLKLVVQRRQDLKVVIMSATIDAGRFSEHFDGAPIIEVPGRVYPVSVAYLEEMPGGANAVTNRAAGEITRYIRRGGRGDILCFMPDEKTIRMTCDALHKQGLPGVRILPLFGNQSPAEQREVFVRDGLRRVIVATNIAETSLTIDGVELVVDSGLIKETVYVSASMSALEVTDHSQAGCNQRAGRAGRTKPGRCLRLFTEDDFRDRRQFTEPEIRRMSLDAVLLHLRTLGYSTKDVIGFPWMDAPPPERWEDAVERLKTLRALDESGAVTDDGRLMERLPVAPVLGRMIIEAERFGCLDAVVTIVASLAARPVFFRVPDDERAEADAAHAEFCVDGSDFLTALAVWQAWNLAGENGHRRVWAREKFVSSRALEEIDRTRVQIIAALAHEGIAVEIHGGPLDERLITKAVAAGLITNLCVKNGPHTFCWDDREHVYVHPGSVLFNPEDRRGEHTPQYLVCAEVVETSKVFARGCSAIGAAMLLELIPPSMREQSVEFERNWMADDDAWTLKVRENYRGVPLAVRKAEGLDDALRALCAQTIARGATNWSCPHPEGNLLYGLYKAWCALRGMNAFSSYGANKADSKECESAFVSTVSPLIAARLEACKTALDVMRISLRELPWEDIADTHVRSALRSAYERVSADTAQEREQYEQKRADNERQKAAIIANAQDARDRMRARFDALGITTEQLYGAQGGYELHSAWVRLLDMCAGASYVDEQFYLRAVHTLELFLQKREEAERKQTERAEALEQAVLEQFPLCPLCGGTWECKTQHLFCGNEHDASRLIALDDAAEPIHRLGEFITDRGERKKGQNVARVELDGQNHLLVRYTLPHQDEWLTFKRICFVPFASVLPEHLLPERAQIVRDLGELRAAREELEGLLARVRETEAQVGRGLVRRLTFKQESGHMVCRETGVLYQAAYEEPYPQAGETWLCRLGAELPTPGERTVIVHPVFRAGSFSSELDLTELREVIEQSYPGLPENLLH